MFFSPLFEGADTFSSSPVDRHVIQAEGSQIEEADLRAIVRLLGEVAVLPEDLMALRLLKGAMHF